MPDPSEDPTIFILATDGEPDTCAQPNPQEGQPEALASEHERFPSTGRLAHRTAKAEHQTGRRSETPRLGLFNHKQGHAVPPEAEQRIYEWFEKYL